MSVLPLSGASEMSLKVKRSQNGFHSQTMSPSASTLAEVSPPSTPSRLIPSPVPPLYTSSPSHASSSMYPAHSKSQPFCEDGHLAPQRNCTQSDTSSVLGPCHCTSMPTTPKVTTARASLESVSLEQHLQHSDTGREEAMQSFILERFLPAAKAMATDHDCTVYTASKHHPLKPSMTSHVSMSKSTKNTSRLHSIPSASSASKGVTWSSQDDDETDDEGPTKSSGFFCVGLKTAISRVHKVVQPSAHSMSRSKCRAAPLSSHEAISDEEEDKLPKVNVGMQKRTNGHKTVSYAFSSSSPTLETIPLRCMASSLPKGGYVGENGGPFVSGTSLDATLRHNMAVDCHSSNPLHQQFFSSSSPTFETVDQRRSSRFMASSRNCLPKGGCVVQDGGPFVSLTSLDVTPLHKMAVDCQLINPSHQQFRCNCSKQTPLKDNACQSCLRPSCDQSCASFQWERAKESTGGTRLKDYPSQNASRCIANDVSFQDPPSRAKPKGSAVHQGMVESALRIPDCTEDDEHEFYDAFDSWSSIPGNVTPLTCTSPKSPKISGSSKKLISDEGGIVDGPSYTPHVFNITSKMSGQEEMEGKESSMHRLSCRSCASLGSAHTAALKQKHGKSRADQANSRTTNGTYSLSPSSAPKIFDPKCRSGTPNGHKKWLSPSERPGWPLGISSVHSSTKKSSFQEQTNNDDRCTANLVSAFTESSVLPSPPVPASPTGSWLGKAMALNACKPSTLATLQQKEKVVSARKKLEFTLSADAKKEVKWEDVVKGSQMHPERIRFSEELRHRHPANRDAIKPLRL